MKSSSKEKRPEIASHSEENAIILFLRRHYYKIATFLWISIFILRNIPGLDFLNLQVFTDLSYRDPSKTDGFEYGVGFKDLYFVFWVTCINISIRWTVENFFFKPLGQYLGIKTEKALHKFVDNGWHGVFYTCIFTYGIYLWSIMPTWLNLEHAWVGYPHTHHLKLFKLYFLIQWGFWNTGIFHLTVQPRGKDHVAMVLHHFVLMALASTCWFANFARIGHLVIIQQDAADVFLPIAKSLNYAKFRRLAEVFFVIFALTWIFTRHLIFGRIMWSIYQDTFRLITSGWNPEVGSYFSPSVIYSYLAFFVVLQALMIYWSYFIFRVICSFKSSNDPRSDSEDEDVVSEKKKKR